MTENKLRELKAELVAYAPGEIEFPKEVLCKSVVSAIIGKTLTWLEHKAKSYGIEPCESIEMPISANISVPSKNSYRKFQIFNWLLKARELGLME